MTVVNVWLATDAGMLTINCTGYTISERIDRIPFRLELRCSVIKNATQTVTTINIRVLIEGSDVNKSFIFGTYFSTK